MIKNLIFDLGGVVFTLDHDEAVRRFRQLGLANAEEVHNPYTQGGIFGELESGKIGEEEFIAEFRKLTGREVGYDDCRHAWLGYCKEVPQRNLDALKELRQKGYRVVLLSNNNPFLMSWCESSDFDGHGNSISYYFDALYKSYEVKYMKPNERFFRHVLMTEKMLPEETLFIDDGPRNCASASQLGINTLCPVNGEDWTTLLKEKLRY